MSIKSILGIATTAMVAQAAEAQTPGIASLLENPTAYEIYLGPNIGSSYATTGFAFEIGEAHQEGPVLTVTYPSYAQGRLIGIIDSEGTYRGTFETSRSSGTFEVRFADDGTAVGEWRLDDMSVARFGITRGAGDTGPNDIRFRTDFQ